MGVGTETRCGVVRGTLIVRLMQATNFNIEAYFSRIGFRGKAAADFATLKGTIDGADGTNTLDYSSYTSSRDIYLQGYGSLTGYSGSEFDTIGSFTNINNIIGGSENDALSGTNDAGKWVITTNNSGTYSSNSRQLTFSSIESLNGSGTDDSFIFKNGAGLNGSIDGRGGSDTLDFTDYTTGITATLLNGYVNVLKAGVTSIENIFGGSGNDILYGNNKDNVLSGGAGDDQIYGLGGNDTLYSGTGSNIISGGDGDDIIWSQAGSNNTLYGGDGYDTAYIGKGSLYIVPLNDIENIGLEPQPEPEPIPVTGTTVEASVGTKANLRVLVVNVISGDQKKLTAKGYDAMILRLPEGNQVFFGFLNGELASLAYFDSFTLTDRLPDDTALVFGMNVSLYQNGLLDKNAKDGMVISFMVPAEYAPEDLKIVYWDETIKDWVEIPSFYVAFEKMTTNDCIKGVKDRYGYEECLFTQWNHTGSIGRIYAVAAHSGRYALLVKGQKVDLSNNSEPVTLTLSNGVVVSMTGGDSGTLVALPEANWNLAPTAETDQAITAFTLYIRSGDETSTDFGGKETTISFKVKDGIPEEQQTIIYWDAASNAWVNVENVTVADGKVQAQVTHGGTYMLIKR